MARVYLSFLGTNDYLACTYYTGDREVENVRFVQEATLGLYCRKWTPDDRIIIFTKLFWFRLVKAKMKSGIFFVSYMNR